MFCVRRISLYERRKRKFKNLKIYDLKSQSNFFVYLKNKAIMLFEL